MRHGDKIPVLLSASTVLADLDFETYSEAGYIWNAAADKWQPIGNAPHGLPTVGAPVYAAHPSTEVLSLAYDLKDGAGPRLWVPGCPPPIDLFEHIAAGRLLEAHNSGFEFYIWHYVCAGRMGWPPLPYTLLRCSMAKARALSLPGKLAKLGPILQTDVVKLDGDRLIKKFSVPRNPTQKDARRRHRPDDADQAADAAQLYAYNLGDIAAEAAVSARLPDLSPTECELWLLDQKINFRGVHIDAASVAASVAIVDQATVKYTAELVQITAGAIQTASEIAKTVAWLHGRGVHLDSVDAESVEAALARPAADIPYDARRVLQIRAALAGSSVKKLYSIGRRVSSDGRIRDMFTYHGAHTGRATGSGAQPQNLPKSGPRVQRCPICKRHYGAGLDVCPWASCRRTSGAFFPGSNEYPNAVGDPCEWSAGAVVDALEVIAYGRLEYVEAVYGDAIATVSGCLRGLFSAAPGHDFICSDYSAIEAVVLAELAGEQWRIDVFKTHGKIYEKSASMITGVPFEEFIEHKKRTGEHHPQRNKIGKFAELSSGYQGSLNAWLNFGAGEHLTDAEIIAAVEKWRAASPNIVQFWYGIEAAAVKAVQYPGTCFSCRDITYGVKDDILFCRLPSGRYLTYHAPRLIPGKTKYGRDVMRLTHMGNDQKTHQWARVDTYGGRMVENLVQAVARDILTHALVNVEAAGYPVVMHVHDEIVSEVPAGFGTVEEFEKVMSTLPAWAAGWPVKASGGWRGKRYRKD